MTRDFPKFFELRNASKIIFYSGVNYFAGGWREVPGIAGQLLKSKEKYILPNEEIKARKGEITYLRSHSSSLAGLGL